MEHRLMTEREKADIFMKSYELEKQGKKEEADLLHRTIPLPPFLAKVLKEKVGADYLIHGGYNLAEAEAKFGQDWINR